MNTEQLHGVEIVEIRRVLEERFEAIEGHDSYGLEAFDTCLVLDVVIPPNFETPYLENYKWIRYPKTYLNMYCQKMAAYPHDDKLLIRYFQDNLSGTSLK